MAVKKNKKLYVVGYAPQFIKHGDDAGTELFFINDTIKCCEDACLEDNILDDNDSEDEYAIYELVPVKRIENNKIKISDWKP